MEYAINLKFSGELTDSPFSWGNDIYRNEANKVTTNVHIIPSKTHEIPLCMIPQFKEAVIKKSDEPIPLEYYTTLQFSGRRLTGPKVVDLVDDISTISKILVNDVPYLFGKGFVAVEHANSIEYLYIATVELDDSKNPDPTSFKIYIANNFKTDHKAIFLNIYNAFIKDFKGDITHSNNIVKYFGARIKLPKFDTLAEQEGFIKQIFSQTLLSIAA